MEDDQSYVIPWIANLMVQGVFFGALWLFMARPLSALVRQLDASTRAAQRARARRRRKDRHEPHPVSGALRARRVVPIALELLALGMGLPVNDAAVAGIARVADPDPDLPGGAAGTVFCLT